MTITELLLHATGKTKIGLVASEELGNAFIQVLKLENKCIDYFSENTSEISGSDFAIYVSETLKNVEIYTPNIVFVSIEHSNENLENLFQSIIPGGVFIFPESMEDKLPNSSNFFRKLPFPEAKYHLDANDYLLETDFGELPISTDSESFVKNINGLKLLAQQLGIMEEEFFLAIASIG